MSTMYDKVEGKVTRLIQKFSEHSSNLTYIENGKTVQLQAAPIKDHLHVYSQVKKYRHDVTPSAPGHA